MIIYIIRHGETDTNTRGLLCGQVDVPLNENGRALARITGAALKNVAFTAIYSSPLSRAYETATLIREQNVSPKLPIITDDRLMEISWGSWEMKCSKADNLELPIDDFNGFYTDTYNFELSPDGESIYDLIDRAESFLSDITANCDDSDTILVTTHGVCARALMQPAFEDRTDFWHGPCPPNCAVNIIEYKNGSYRIINQDMIFYDEALSRNLFKAD